MLEDFLKLLSDATSKDTIDTAMLARGSAWIEALQQEFPLAHALITGLVYKTPREVLTSLAVFQPDIKPYVGNEHALAYVAALQTKLRGNRK